MTEPSFPGQELLPGLEFTLQNGMTPAEVNVFLTMMRKPMSASDVATMLKSKKTTVHNLILKLKYKGLIKEHTFVGHTKVFAVNLGRQQ